MEIIYDMKDEFRPYFENRMNNIVPKITNDKIKKIIVTAGAFRAYGASITWVYEEQGIVNIDWYSALRAGFGQVSDSDLIDGFNNGEIGSENELTYSCTQKYICIDTEDHIEWFKRYLKVQIKGDYNMYTDAAKASEEAGLTPEQYIFVFNNYKLLDSKRPEIREEIEKAIMAELLNKSK